MINSNSDVFNSFIAASDSGFLTDVFKNCHQELQLVNKKLREISNRCFDAYNKQIISLCPEIINYTEISDADSPIVNFKLLVNALHSQGRKTQFSRSIAACTMAWECMFYEKLAREVNQYFENGYIKAHDFSNFIRTVKFLTSVDLNLKNIDVKDKDTDWKTLDVANHEIWQTNLNHPKIDKLDQINISTIHVIFSKYDVLDVISPEIGQLTKLEYLSISKLQITKLPNEISSLKNLRVLRIDSCQSLEKFPRIICKISDLRKLRLVENENLKELPPEMGNLTNLQELSVRSIRLPKLPSEIQQLMKLKILNLDGFLPSFPLAICSLTQLENLDLNNNRLKTISSEISRLVNLKCLNLENNLLRKFPEEFLNCSKLRTLVLNKCDLTDIPSSINKLSSLQSLYLNSNPLTKTSFPIELGQLDQLKYLIVDKDEDEKLTLEDLPESVRKRVKSNQLDVYFDFDKT